MAADFTVRPAAEPDMETARQLIDSAGLPLDGFEDAAHVFLAERDGVLLGVAALEDHVDDNGRALLLRSVAVQAQARGDGIGAALVHTALRTVEHDNLPVTLLTETAANYFPRFGFSPVARDALPSALAASKELQGACAISAVALIRQPTPTPSH